MVAIYAAPDLYQQLSTYNPQYDRPSIFPAVVVMALHVFHCLVYTINSGDILHHAVMCTVLLIPLLNSNDTQMMGFTNCGLFFLSGLPGGIDYYLMVLVETGQITKQVEKYYNLYLNTWIRSVGILYGAFCAYQQWLIRTNIQYLFIFRFF